MQRQRVSRQTAACLHTRLFLTGERAARQAGTQIDLAVLNVYHQSASVLKHICAFVHHPPHVEKAFFYSIYSKTTLPVYHRGENLIWGRVSIFLKPSGQLVFGLPHLLLPFVSSSFIPSLERRNRKYRDEGQMQRRCWKVQMQRDRMKGRTVGEAMTTARRRKSDSFL